MLLPLITSEHLTEDIEIFDAVKTFDCSNLECREAERRQYNPDFEWSQLNTGLMHKLYAET